jgi:hypothetical protein
LVLEPILHFSSHPQEAGTNECSPDQHTEADGIRVAPEHRPTRAGCDGYEKEDVRDDEIRLVQERTRERVWAPMSHDLKAVLVNWMKYRTSPILTTPTGTPMKEDYF